MKKFSIKELERFSDIKAHTLRTWEFRHSIIKPQRSITNLRFYTLDEVKRILNISLLNRRGWKVSILAGMNDEAVNEKVGSIKDDDFKQEKAVIDLLMHMYEMESEKFEELLNNCLLQWNADIVLKEIVYNFLKKSHLLWKGNGLSEEHFVVTIIRKKIVFAIEQAVTKPEKEKQILLFLSDDRQLDLALLYANYLLKINGAKVLYMGNNVSVKNLQSVFAIKKPDFIYTYSCKRNDLPLEELTCLLKETIPHSKLVATIYSNKNEPALQNNFLQMEYDDAMNLLCN